MLLYATVTSERASKGQGGKFLDIEIAGSDKRTALTLHFETDGDRIIPSVLGGTPELIRELHNELKQAVEALEKEEKLFEQEEAYYDEKEFEREQHGRELDEQQKKLLDYSLVPTKKIEDELKELQAFLYEETSSTGKRDYLMEQAMIKELAKRKGNKKKDEPSESRQDFHCKVCKDFDEWNNCKACGRSK